MVDVVKLGHVAFNSPDADAFVDYYVDVLGFVEEARGDAGEVYLRCSLDHHSIVVYPSADEAGFRSVGLQINSGMTPSEAAQRLRAAGVEAQTQSDPQPGIGEAVRLQDPDGYPVLLYSEIELSSAGFPSQLGVAPHKLGHAALFVADLERTKAFYIDMLGFRFSDQLGDYFAFMRCNPDHHSLNFLQPPKPRRGLQHIAFELNDWAHHQRAADWLFTKDIPVEWGPGRHGMGHNIFAYHRDPDRNIVELFCELDVMLHEDLGYFEPRPYHEDSPQRPKIWSVEGTTHANHWGPQRPESFLL